MIAKGYEDSDLFDGGPPLRLQRAVGLVRPDAPRFVRRAALAAVAAWMPLLLLAAADGAAASFLRDYAVHARFLIALPLLVLAEPACIRRLGNIAAHFVESGLVPASERDRIHDIYASTRRLRDSWLVEAAAVILAYAIVALLIRYVPPEAFPLWHKAPGRAAASFSLAGWWHLLVSLPLLLVLVFGWLWRLLLWTRVLWLVSRLDLQLIPAHPDGAAGLAFVGYSLRAFAILGLTLGVVLAGRVIERALHHGESPIDSIWPIVGLLIVVLALFGGPLLVFVPSLLRTWRRGVFEYGALAGALGRQFERKWLEHPADTDKAALEVPDFSATTDLYQITSNVYRIRLVPLDLTSTLLLLGATLLPFAPAALVIVPFERILEGLGKVFF